MKKLITLLLVSAFLFAVTIIPAGAVTCWHDEERFGNGRHIMNGDANGCISYRCTMFKCRKCGVIRYEYPRLMRQEEHVFCVTNLGHQVENEHRFMRRCCRCGYACIYTVQCDGILCQGIETILPESE